MKLFGFEIQLSRATNPENPLHFPAASGAAKSFSPSSWAAGGDLDSGMALSNAYEQVVWVYRAINALAEQVANVPFVFSAGERGRETLITSGPLHDFYGRPHPQLNRFQYWELRVIWLMLRGECVRVPVYMDDAGRESHSRSPGSRSVLRRVLLPDPARFQHIIEDHQLIGWRYTGLGPRAPLASQVFLPEEVWFERLPNPFDFWRGLSPLQVAHTAARTDFAAAALMRGLIENNGDAGVIVRTDKWLSDEQREQIVAALRDRKRRAGQADRPVLLLGSTEVLKPQLSSSDLQFLENRKFTRAEICAAFGVPEEVVTTTEHAKYDVMTGARLNFIENRIAPLCSRLEAEEDITVKCLDPRASGWFDLDSLPIMQEARRSRLAAARTGFEMGVPFNELNRVLDLGFKPLPWGDRGYVGGGVREVEAEGRTGKKHVTNPSPGLAATLSPSDRERDGVRGKSQVISFSPPPSFPRFLFEQRGRVLQAIHKNFNAALVAGDSESEMLASNCIFDLERENQALRSFLQARTVSGEAAIKGDSEARQATLEQLNQAAADALNGLVRQARAEAWDASKLAAQVKAFYNKAGHAAEA